MLDRAQLRPVEFVGIERSTEGLRRASAGLRRLKGEVDAYVRTRTSRSLYELRSACVVALLITRAASENPESWGCHYLADGTSESEADDRAVDTTDPASESEGESEARAGR